MDEIEQDEVIEDTEVETETPEETPEEVTEKPAKETPEAKLARIEREAKQLRKKLGKEEPEARVQPKVESKKESKTDELDETQLDYLDLKGISDQDEIDIVHSVMKKTGQTVREALKDDYVQSKLEKFRADKAVKDATPSSTKRSGNQSSDLAAALAKFDSKGELPDDFTLRTAVVNAVAERGDSSKPSWHGK